MDNSFIKLTYDSAFVRVMYFSIFFLCDTNWTKPRRVWWSFLWIFTWSVNSRIRWVRI